MRHQAGQRLPPGQSAQRFHGRAAQELVAQQVEQGRGGLGVADLPQRADGRVLEPRLRAQDLDEGEDRPGVADLPEAGRGGVADVEVRVGEGGDEPFHRPPLAARPQHHRREVAHLLVGIVEQLQQGLAGAGAQLDVDLHRRVAHPRVLVVAQRGLQPRQQRFLGEGGQGLGGGLAHGPALVRHRHQQRGHRLRLARAAQLLDHPPPHRLFPAAQRLERRLDVKRHCRFAFKRGGRRGKNEEDAETDE